MFPPMKKSIHCCPLKIHQHICLVQFWSVFTYKWCLICAYFFPDSDWDYLILLLLEKAMLWIEDSYLIDPNKQWFEVKNILIIDVFITNMQLFTSLESCYYLWIIVMFLSAVWTFILTAPIHCRGSIGEQVM